MTLDDKKKYFNLCDPDESLEPDDPRNIDLDSIKDSNNRLIRGINWADEIVEDIVLSDKPKIKFFTGHPGSGKTTELKRIVQRLREDFFPVFIDAKPLINLESPIEPSDIITVIVYSAEKAIAETEGRNPENIHEEGFLKRLWEALTKTDIDIGKGEFSIPAVGKLVFEMKAREQLRKKIRDGILTRFTVFLEEARNYLEEFNRTVISEFGRKGMVVIVDSLEKLGENNESNWHEILQSAEMIFNRDLAYLKLPVHVIYTFPPALINRVRLDEYFLPMIKTYDKDRHPNESGMAVMRELIRLRLPEEVQTEIFGPCSKERIDRLILWSGGYPRDLLRMLQNAVKRKEFPISDNEFEHILVDIFNRYRSRVPTEAFEWLAKTAKEHYPNIEDYQKSHKIAAHMFKNHIVLRYLNDEEWFDLHPAVYEIPGVRKAIDDLEK